MAKMNNTDAATTPALDDELLEHLRRFDTPTICNALDIAAPERPRDEGFTRQPLVPLYPALPPIVGYARTAKISASTMVTADEKRQMALKYYAYTATGPGPAIIVVEDIDTPAGLGAHWGEVHTKLHKKLGACGAITNGTMRDLDDSAADFQVLAAGVGPSHAYVHVTEYSCPVSIFGMAVSPGDLIHADKHGAVVIPAGAAGRLPGAIETIIKREKVILDVLADPDFSFNKLEQAVNQAADTH